MSQFAVRRVTINGTGYAGLDRELTSGIGNQFQSGSGIGATVETVDNREGSLRLNDFRGLPLTPSLHPDAGTQTFVSGPVLEKAERVLSEEAAAAARLVNVSAEPMEWDGLAFQLTPTDVMASQTIENGGEWTNLDLYPYSDIPISPAAASINYGQELFEGMKALRSANGGVVLFRPEENAKRMIDGAKRLGLTPVPEKIFLDAVERVVMANERWIPPMGKGALYIRPLLIGSGGIVGVAPDPENRFSVFVTPVGPYFKGGMSAIKLLVADNNHRAAPGGSGAVKAGGNYAPGMIPAQEAKARGFSEVIYLDAVNHRYVEEVGAANFFYIDQQRVIHTPRLSGTILPGINRRSVMKIARDLGYEVCERDIPIHEVMANGAEAFCTGTAAVISPIGSITHGDDTAMFNGGDVGPISLQLYGRLTAIQEEREEDPYEWVYPLRG